MKLTRTIQRDAKRLFQLCMVNGTIDEGRARRVVHRILDGHRSGSLPTLSRLERLIRLDLDRHTVTVESAAPLAAEARVKITERLARMYGTGLSTSFAENPTLLGGVRIKVGSDVYDGSVKGGLAALAARF
jgi:F-type H+-transporting ATPase subunit delta